MPRQPLQSTIWLLALSLAAGAASAQGPRDPDVPAEEAYREGLEEIIVRGRAPEWRPRETPPDWRKPKFELPEDRRAEGVNWFPEYTLEERELYDEVRDRMEEDPKIKIFEFKF